MNEILLVFSFEKLKTLYNECEEVTVDKKTIKVLSSKLKKYIHRYFFQTDSNMYLFFNAKKQTFDSFSKVDMKELFFDKLPSEIGKYFFYTSTKLFHTIMDTAKPRITDSEINLFNGFIHPKKPYADYKEEVKEAVELFLSYMREVLCSNRDDVFDYMINWIANMAQGKKNDSVLYLKSIEGTGKSTFSDFLKNFVIGKKNATISDSEPLLSAFNKELCGKLLIIFEELPCFTDKQWEGVSSKLKKAVTADTEKYSDKFEKRFECENLNNYIINTNVEALKHSEGRRYMLLDVSTTKKGNHEYFGNLRKQCFSMEVGEAFFNYLQVVDVTKYNPQDMPETSNKLDAIIDRLDYVYRYLKEEYLFKKKEINHTVADLFGDYEVYCKSKDRKPYTKMKFNQKMKEIQIQYYCSHGQTKYRITLDSLKALAKKHNWIHELDDYHEEETDKKTEELPYVDLLTKNKQLLKEIKELKKQISVMKVTGDVDTINVTINNNYSYDDDDKNDPTIIFPKENWFSKNKKINVKTKLKNDQEAVDAIGKMF